MRVRGAAGDEGGRQAAPILPAHAPRPVRPLDALDVRGFKSFADLKLTLNRGINVLVGANGAGKSNFLSLFRFMEALVQGRLQAFVAENDYAARLLYYGLKSTPELALSFRFGEYGYEARLKPTASGGLFFESERFANVGDRVHPFLDPDLGGGHSETKVTEAQHKDPTGIPMYAVGPMRWWRLYNFHDTSPSAPVKQHQDVVDYRRLRADGSNVAPFLLDLKRKEDPAYERIREAVCLAFPQFGDFELDPEPGQRTIQLLWRERESDLLFLPDQLSDGTLRFICLATLLLQPRRDSTATLFIDEPELGLHPAALTLLADLVREASERRQIVLATQSVALLNAFTPDEVIVVDRERRTETGRYASVCRRLDAEEYAAWLEEYTLGELWLKNVLGGRP
jgi:predicted ATPase